MNRTLFFGVAASLLVTGAAAAVAVSAQDATLTPGQPTQARVWIQNRGEGEAIPVSIQETAQPLRVELATAPTVMVAPGTVWQTRATRQAWEYRTVRVTAGQNVGAVLNGAGTDGWEVTGATVSDQSGTVVIMKRPGQ